MKLGKMFGGHIDRILAENSDFGQNTKATSRMRLLIVTQIVDLNDDVLGAFHQWIRRFAEVFESVEVVCLRKGQYDLPGNVKVHSLGKETGRSRLKYIRRFFGCVIGLRKEYDAVFVHMNPEYVVLAGWLWRLMGKTVFLWFAHKRGGWLRRAALFFTTRVVSVSKESFADSWSRKFIAVGHGVDPDVFACERNVKGQVPSAKIILSVGRLSPIKEYDLLIDAAGLLKTKYGRSDFLVRLIGAPANPEDGAYVEGLKKKISRLGLAGAFEFAGPVPNKDIVPFLCESAAFVSMQHGGGAGKNFLEAMSCGLPTVVRTPVFNEYLGEWKPYLFYDGAAEDFAAKLDKTLSLSGAERGRMAADLRNIVVEHHNLKKLARRLLSEYEALSSKRT